MVLMHDVRSTFLVGNTSTCTVVPRRRKSVGMSTCQCQLLTHIFFSDRHTFIDTIWCLRTLHWQLSVGRYHLSEWPRTWKLPLVLLSDHISRRSKRMPQGTRVYKSRPSRHPSPVISQRQEQESYVQIHSYCTSIIGYGYGG